MNDIIEYANGTRLRNLSLRHWDQDDENEIAGSHMTGIENAFPLPYFLLRLLKAINKCILVREGMSHLVGKLVNTSDVLTLRRVTNIEYREEGSFLYASN